MEGLSKGIPVGTLQRDLVPLVSVLIPSFNHARYLPACLDSVRSDDYSNIELRIVDDGSNDDSLRIAREWARINARHFAGGVTVESQSNQGLIVTLNRLIDSCKGDFFALLASDDKLIPGGIAARVSHLMARPELLAVFADAKGIDENGFELHRSVLQDFYGADVPALECSTTRPLELMLQWCVPGPVFMARREVVGVIGTYDQDFALEDRNFCLRLLERHALGFLNRSVAEYRIHGNSQIGNLAQRDRMLKEIARVDSAMTPRFSGLERLAMGLRLNSYRWRVYENNVVPNDGSVIREGARRSAHYAAAMLREINRIRARLCRSYFSRSIGA